MVDLQAPRSAVAPDGPRAGRPARPHGLLARLRAAGVAGVSAFVVLAAVVFVLAPPSSTVQLSVDEIAGTPSYDHDVTPSYSLASARLAARGRWKETFYGTVEAKGVPVSRVVLRVSGAERRTRGQRATIAIGGTGTYRSVVRLKPGRYRLALSLRAGGRTKTVATTRTIKNRRAYLVSVKVKESGIVTFLPVTTY